jgi:hypothetical protein
VLQPNFLPWLDHIFSRMAQSAEPALSVPGTGAKPKFAARTKRADFEPDHANRLEIKLIKAIADLMGAAERIDRLKDELAATGGGKPCRRDRLEPIAEGRPLRGKRIRLLVVVERDFPAAVADEKQSAKHYEYVVERSAPRNAVTIGQLRALSASFAAHPGRGSHSVGRKQVERRAAPVRALPQLRAP